MSDTNTPASGSSAGLTFAPPYDPSQELDPQTVQAVRENPDIRELRYFKEHEARRTTRSRVALLALIFTMLAGNMYMTWASQAAVQSNLDQTRLDQVALTEAVESRVGALTAQNKAMRAEIAALHAAIEATGEVAVAAR